MPHQFAAIAFTPTVREVQESLGSRAAYARMDAMEGIVNHQLGEAEKAFIAARNSLYMATVGETGWPYVQHRGGPAGFVRVLNGNTIGFADYRGNRQYISVGNLRTEDRISMFFMDYPSKTRLKLLGRARTVALEDEELLSQLEMPHYRARVERGFVVTVEAFDWNCPQHITPRYTREEIDSLNTPLHRRIAELEAEVSRLRSGSQA